MAKDTLKLELAPVDMRILRECAHFRTIYWKKCLEKCAAGDASPMDFDDCHEEVDLEYFVDRHQFLLNRIHDALGKVPTNELEYLDEFQMFRPTQRVECVRLIGAQTTKLMFIFHTRHGSIFLYEQLEDLTKHFLDDSEPQYRFESEAELEWFLKYWKLGIS